MPKALRVPQSGKDSQIRVAELDPKQAVAGRLEKLIAELDVLREDLAATYAQMALDTIRR